MRIRPVLTAGIWVALAALAAPARSATPCDAVAARKSVLEEAQARETFLTNLVNAERKTLSDGPGLSADQLAQRITRAESNLQKAQDLRAQATGERAAQLDANVAYLFIGLRYLRELQQLGPGPGRHPSSEDLKAQIASVQQDLTRAQMRHERARADVDEATAACRRLAAASAPLAPSPPPAAPLSCDQLAALAKRSADQVRSLQAQRLVDQHLTSLTDEQVAQKIQTASYLTTEMFQSLEKRGSLELADLRKREAAGPLSEAELAKRAEIEIYDNLMLEGQTMKLAQRALDPADNTFARRLREAKARLADGRSADRIEAARVKATADRQAAQECEPAQSTGRIGLEMHPMSKEDTEAMKRSVTGR